METRGTPDWRSIRGQYPGLDNVVYLDTSSCGLIARSTMDVAVIEQERLMREGSARFGHWHMQGRTDAA